MIINQVVSGGGGSAPAHYIEKTVDANGKLVNGATSVIDFTGVTDIGEYVLNYAYYTNTAISGAVDMSGLTTISGSNACNSMFQGCTGLTSVDLSGLTTISGGAACQNMFQGCTNLSQADISKLEAVRFGNSCQSIFYGCTNLTHIDVSSINEMSGFSCFQYAFRNSGLVYIEFDSLNTFLGSQTGSQALGNCFQGTQIQSVWFYALTPSSFGTTTNMFKSMLSGVTGCAVHFPIAIQSTIGSWSDVTSGFGGTNTTVLYDIVTTLTGADANTYTRSEKDSTATATAWLYNDTLYYTNGVSGHTAGVHEPVVNDTIYSDSACTTAVTTISSIA